MFLPEQGYTSAGGMRVRRRGFTDLDPYTNPRPAAPATDFDAPDTAGFGQMPYGDEDQQYLPPAPQAAAPSPQPKPPSALDQLQAVNARRPTIGAPAYKPRPLERVGGILAGAGLGFAEGYLNSGRRGPVVRPGTAAVVADAITNRRFNKAQQQWEDEYTKAKGAAEIEAQQAKNQREAEYQRARLASEEAATAASNATSAYRNRQIQQLGTPKPLEPPKNYEEHLVRVLNDTNASDTDRADAQKKLDAIKGKPANTPNTIEERINQIRLDPNLPTEEKDRLVGVAVGDYNKLHPDKPVTQLITDDSGMVRAVTKSGGKTTVEDVGQFGKTKSVPASQSDSAKEAIEAAAQALAKGDLTRLRDIASLRGEQRLLVYTRAKQLNPNFNTAEIDRMIKMQDDVENGATSRNLQSFDIFLQHAANAQDAFNGMNNTSARFVNQPLNRIRSAVGNTPEYKRLVAALEPAAKEYMTFLLNNHALQEDDRHKLDRIISGDESPANAITTLREMAHAAQARIAAVNNRYRRVMKKDLQDDVISPEGRQAAANLGITQFWTSSAPKGKTGGNNPASPQAKVKLRAPNGQVSEVPADQVEHYLKLGAKRVQ